MSARLLSIEGTAPLHHQPVSASQWAAALESEVGVAWWLTPRLRLGTHLGVSWLRPAQRYLVGGEPVFEVGPLAFETILTLGFKLPEY